jgi:hypothetical protein
VGLFINEGSFSKASALPLFLEDENIFQKSVSVQRMAKQREPIFEKCSHL